MTDQTFPKPLREYTNLGLAKHIEALLLQLPSAEAASFRRAYETTANIAWLASQGYVTPTKRSRARLEDLAYALEREIIRRSPK